MHELWARVEEVWHKIDKETCQNLIESMPSRVLAVKKAKGGHTKYQNNASKNAQQTLSAKTSANLTITHYIYKNKVGLIQEMAQILFEPRIFKFEEIVAELQ